MIWPVIIPGMETSPTTMSPFTAREPVLVARMGRRESGDQALDPDTLRTAELLVLQAQVVDWRFRRRMPLDQPPQPKCVPQTTPVELRATSRGKRWSGRIRAKRLVLRSRVLGVPLRPCA